MAQSGMGQGEAAISVRSDVTMAVRSLGATTRERVQAFADAYAPQLGALKACYAKRVAKQPKAVGKLRVDLSLPAGKTRATLTIRPKPGSDRAVIACTRKLLAKVPLPAAETPAQALILLRFTNTRAEGQAAMEAFASEAAFEAGTTEDGRPVLRWTSPDKKLRLSVRGPSGTDPERLRQALRGLRSAYAGLLDCRRRASKRASPQGELVLSLRPRPLKRGGRNRVKTRSCTVAAKHAPRCVERSLRRARFPAPPAPKFEVRLTFFD